MSKIVKGKISDLKQDAKNFNKHSEFGMRLLEKSMRKFGFVEAGVISEDGVIVGGNARNEVAEDIGISDKQIIDIDGTKQVYLRKKGLLSNSDEFKEMALALNAVPKANIVFDADILEAEVSEAVCEEWGVDTGNDYAKGLDVNNMSEDDLDFLEQFDPVGTSKGLQRVVFIFDGAEEAQSWLDKTDPKLPMVKRNMAWQVDLSTQST